MARVFSLFTLAIFFILGCRSGQIGPVDVKGQQQRNAETQGRLDHAIKVAESAKSCEGGMSDEEKQDLIASLYDAKSRLRECSSALQRQEDYTKEQGKEIASQKREIDSLAFFARIGKIALGVIGLLCAAVIVMAVVRLYLGRR